MKHGKSENIGIIMISAVMLYWGFTTILMKHALLYMGSTTYIMLRFLIAAAIVLPLYGRRLLNAASPALFAHSCILGLLELVPMETTALALRYTTSANSVFISQLSFVFVPLIQCLLSRKFPEKKLLQTILFLLLGLSIFADIWHAGIDAGCIYSLIAALFYAVHILCVNRFTATDDAELLGVLQIAFCGLLSIPVWLFAPGGVTWCLESLQILFFTSIIGSAAAFVIYLAGQARTSPITVSFLGLLQPIFAMIGGAVLKDERGQVEAITPNMLIGAGIILFTLICFLKSPQKNLCKGRTHP